MSIAPLKPIEPNPARWQPSSDPSSIVVPGLDTTASVYDQIDQIEQLITLKLQNIDANFSKIQSIMSSKLLPAVKRYAIGTEPVREAAKFWTSFYEEAAQIRIPTYEDYSSIQEQQTRPDETNNTIIAPELEPSITSTEDSFRPGQAAYSSTPATVSRSRGLSSHDNALSLASDETPSWTASIESPLVRLDREIQNLTREQLTATSATPFAALNSLRTPSVPSNSLLYSNQKDTSDEPSSNRGKAREEPESLLRNLLRQQHISSADEFSSMLPTTSRTPAGPSHGISPLKLRSKPKSPLPKTHNPYLPPDTHPDKWTGVVDLSHHISSSPRRQDTFSNTSSALRVGQTPSTPQYDDTYDDSTMEFPTGMSPPVTIQFARAPRSSVGLGLPKIGRTPKSEAAQRIKRDILGHLEQLSDVPSPVKKTNHRLAGVRDISKADRVVESSMSTVPTPPSLSRYIRHGPGYSADSNDSIGFDPSLESMMRRVGFSMATSSSQPGSTAHSTAQSSASVKGSLLVPPSIPLSSAAQDPRTPDQQQVDLFNNDIADVSIRTPLPDSDSDSDSDSLDDEPHNTAHPSAAFLMASQRQQGLDDSFGSSNNSSDSLGDEPDDATAVVAPVHPFARGYTQAEGDDFDDSFEDDEFEGRAQTEEETLFGVPPAQRSQAPDRRDQRELRMLGEDLLQDTLGVGTQQMQLGRVEESPTPWGVGGAPRNLG